MAEGGGQTTPMDLRVVAVGGGSSTPHLAKRDRATPVTVPFFEIFSFSF